jgi:hypothetical protein
LPGLQLCARAVRSKAGAAIKATPVEAAPVTRRRRVIRVEAAFGGMIDLREALEMDQYICADL